MTLSIQCRNILVVSLFLLIAAVAGCSKKTTVVLLPDPDGKVGKVVVATEAGEVEINQAREATTVKGDKKLPATPAIVSEATVEKEFGKVLAVLPQPPKHFILYFKIESTQLTWKSKKVMPDIFEVVDEKESQHISVIGHADTAGDTQYNLRLSRRRAAAVEKMLVEAGVSAEYITSTSHGENNPLVKTADNVPEPRNRRVEVVVR